MTTETPYMFEKKGIPANALDQGTWWYTRNGDRYQIRKMSPYHKKNAAIKLMAAHPVEKVIGSKLLNALTS